MFGVRGFKVSRELETSFESAMTKIRQEQEQPQEQDPEALKAQEAALGVQAKMQLDTQKLQADTQMGSQKMQLEAQIESSRIQLEVDKLEHEKFIAQQELEIEREKIALERQKGVNEIAKALLTSKGDEQVTEADTSVLDAINQGLQVLAEIQANSSMAVAQSFQNPPAREVIRDDAGNIVGIK
jgi:hypothetical protein